MRAQNELAGTFDKVSREVDKLTAAQKRNVDQTDKVSTSNQKIARDIEDARKRYAAFTDDVAKNGKEIDDATAHLKRFSQEFSTLARTQKAGTPLFEDLTRAARSAQQLSDQITAARKKQEQEVESAYRQAKQIDDAYSKLEGDRVERERQATTNRKSFVTDLLGAVRDADAKATNITDDGAKKRVSITEREMAQRREVTRKANRDFASEMSAFFSEMEQNEQKLRDFEIKEAARVESVRSSSNTPATEAVTRTSRDRVSASNLAAPFVSDRDLDQIGRASTAVRKLASDEERATGSSRGLVGALHSVLGVDPAKLERMNAVVDDVEATLGRGSFTAIRFAGTLRSLVYVGAFVFFQELTGAAIALGGALVSVASAAVQAGGAIAGSLAAGAAQAIPVVGLLAAAWGRVGAVFKAVQQEQKNQVQAGYDAAQAADRQRSAADAIRSAQEGLVNSNERATEAQQALTKAREDAVRTIEDLVDAEHKAELQAESAALAQKNSAAALAAAFRSGNVGDLAQKALDVRSSNLDLTEANTSNRRAQADAATAVAGGVEGNAGVVSAKRALQDAAQSAGDATRALAEAQQRAGEVTHEISTADRTLQQMLAQLSPAERRLYDGLVTLQNDFKSIFSGGPGRDGVLGPIIDAFTSGVDRLVALLHDHRLIQSASDLSKTIGGQLKRAFSFLTGPTNISFIEDMAAKARSNLPIVISILEHVFGIVRNIAIAGAPAFKAFLKFFDDIASKGDKATSSESGISRMEAFFSKGEKYAESIFKLAGAVAQLFAAIIGSSAQQGQNAIDAITSKIQEATKWIDDHRDDVRNFFSQAVQATGKIASLAGTVAKALFGLFEPKQLDKFTNTLQTSVIPALSGMAQAVGIISGAFLTIVGTKAGSILFQLAFVIGAMNKLVTPLIGLFLRFGIDISRVFGAEGLVGILTTALKFFKPVSLAIIAIYAAVEVLNGKLPKLHDLLKVIDGILGAILLKIYGPAALKAGFDALAPSLAKVGGAAILTSLGRVAGFFGSMLGNVRLLIERIPILGGLIRKTPALPGGLSPVGGRPGVVIGPGTRRVLTTEEAQAAERGAARTVATGAAEATTAGAAASKAGLAGGAEGALSKAGPIIAAVVGLATFLTSKGNVLQRAQSTLSAFTFGLVPAPDLGQKGASAAALQNLGRGTSRALTQGVDVLHQVGVPANIPTGGTGFGAASPGTTTIRTAGGATSLDQIKTAIERAAKDGSNKLSPNDALLLQQVLGVSNLDKIANWDQIKKNFDSLSRPVQQAIDVLGRFKTSIKQINLVNVIDPDQVTQFLDNLRKMRSGTASSIKQVQTDLDNGIEHINNGFASGSEDWYRAIAQNFGAAIDFLKSGMADGKISVDKGLHEINKITKQQMQFVADNMSKLSEDGKTRLAANFESARQAVVKSVGGMAKATGAALKTIRSLMTQELMLYGITPDKAKSITAQGYTGDDAFRAAGRGQGEGHAAGGRVGQIAGWVGRQGERGRDAVNTVLGRGEAVLNWAHQNMVEPAMQAAYGFGLDGMFRKVGGVHAGGASLGMAAGGRAGADVFDGHPSNVISGIKSLIVKMKGLFPLSVTSTTDHSLRSSTGGISDHSDGHAVDLAGSTSVMDRAVKYIMSSGLFRQLKQGIHNPGLSINLGKVVPSSFWDIAWQQHINHIHLALAGALKAVSGGVSSTIKRVLVRGSGSSGAFGEIAQAATDTVRSAFNRILKIGAASSTATAGSGADAAGIPTFTGAWTSVMAKIAAQKKWNLDDWKWIVGHESGGRVSVKNPTSTAFGLGQLLDSTYSKYGGGPGSSGTDQIEAMARYIADRYSNPTAAKAFWQAHNWYESGGQVAGKIGQAVPIVAHAGEWVLNKLQQSKLAGWMGTTTDAVKGALGFSGGPVSYKGGGDVKAYVEPADVGSDPGSLTAELGRAAKIVARLKTSIIDSKFTDKLSTTFVAITGDGGLFDQLSDAITTLGDNLQTNIARATFKLDKAGNVIKKLGDKDVADKTLASLREVYGALNAEQEGVRSQLDGVAKRLKGKDLTKSQRSELLSLQKNLHDKLETVRSAVAQNLSDQFQSVEDGIQAVVDDAQNTSDKATFGIGIAQRLRAVLGAAGSGALPGPVALGQATAGALNAQADQIQHAADLAKKAGHTDTYQKLVQQIVDLRTQAIEAVKAGLQQAESDIEDAASKQQARISIRDRAADLLQKVGNTAGAFALRASNLAATGASLTGERAGLAALRQSATNAGQWDVVSELNDKIADLDQSIAENTEATHANTIAAQQANIDAITSRQGFLGSVSSGLGSIITNLGQLTGVTNVGEQRSVLSGAGATLKGTGSQLATELFSDYGIDVRGKDPLGIVDFFKNFNFDQFEMGLSPDARTQFEGLISSIIDNTGAQVDNTNQLHNLDGSIAQTFQSTAWQRFRTAIFDGANGLLPSFSMSVPSAAIGARVMADGLVYAHSGEKIQPAAVSGYDGGGDTYNMHLTSPTEVFDPTDAARQFAFARRHHH